MADSLAEKIVAKAGCGTPRGMTSVTLPLEHGTFFVHMHGSSPQVRLDPPLVSSRSTVQMSVEELGQVGLILTAARDVAKEVPNAD